MVSQKAQYTIHGVEVRAVEQVPSLASGIDKARGTQGLEMKRQRWRRNFESPGDFAWRVAFWAALHQQPEQREAGLLGKCGEGGNR